MNRISASASVPASDVPGMYKNTAYKFEASAVVAAVAMLMSVLQQWARLQLGSRVDELAEWAAVLSQMPPQ